MLLLFRLDEQNGPFEKLIIHLYHLYHLLIDSLQHLAALLLRVLFPVIVLPAVDFMQLAAAHSQRGYTRCNIFPRPFSTGFCAGGVENSVENV